MNVLMIFILLFLSTLYVKETHNSDATQSGEEKNLEKNSNPDKNVDAKSSGQYSTITDLPEQTGGSSVPINPTSTSKPTKSPEIQNINKCENKSVSFPAADTDPNKGNQSDENLVLKLDLKTMYIFLLGVVCSTVIVSAVLCFMTICKRFRGTDANTDRESIILEVVRSENDQPMMQPDEGQADKHDHLQVQTPAEDSPYTAVFYKGTEEKMKLLGKEQTKAAGEKTDVEYAAINYSLLPKKDDEDLKPRKVESDYAEIQLNNLNEGEEAQTLQDGVNKDELK